MRVLRILFLLVTLVACAFAGAADQVAKIKPGDKLAVTCQEEPGLSKEYTVTQDGLLVLPFLGAIEVKGKTEIEAAAAISGELIDQRILRKATVSVKLVVPEAAPPVILRLKISGAVKRGLELPFTDGLRLSDLVRLAEPTQMADLQRIEVRPATGDTKLVKFVNDASASVEQNPYLKAGDQVFVPVLNRLPQFFVLGGVAKPGLFSLNNPVTIRQAIEMAGGYDTMGDPRRVRLEREGETPTIYDLNNSAVDLALMPGDRVVVELSAARRYLVVLGNVARPGQIEFREGMTLTQALADAGGISESAPSDRVAVFSATDSNMKKPVTYNVQKIFQGFMGDVALAPGDRVEALKPGQRNPKGFVLFAVAAAAMVLLGR